MAAPGRGSGSGASGRVGGPQERAAVPRFFPSAWRRIKSSALASLCSLHVTGEEYHGKRVVVSSNRHETKVAVLEDDQLVEIYFQLSNEYSLAGSIHKGRVTRVLPGMQSAFCGHRAGARRAFLYVSDFFEEHEEYERSRAPAETTGAGAERGEVAAPATAAAGAAQAAARAGRRARSERPARALSRGARSRGRGFPESKYAAPAVVAEEGAESDAPAETEFPVLPGESLAKYGSAAGAVEELPAPEESAGAGEAGADQVAAAAGESGQRLPQRTRILSRAWRQKRRPTWPQQIAEARRCSRGREEVEESAPKPKRRWLRANCAAAGSRVRRCRGAC
jgi:Ribonuclease G/E